MAGKIGLKRRIAPQEFPGPAGSRERGGVGIGLGLAPIRLIPLTARGGHRLYSAAAAVSGTGAQRIGPLRPPAAPTR